MKTRVAASVAVTALVAGALSGCAFFTPQQTARSYTPSDGVNGSVGQVVIRNVLLVTDEQPGDSRAANMLGVLVNRAGSAQTVTLQYDTVAGTETTTLTVPASGALSIRPDIAEQSGTGVTTTARAVQLADVEADPGGLFNVGFSVGSEDPVTLRLPVLTGTLSEYSTLLPTPTPTPTRPTPSSSAATPDPDASTSAERPTP